MSTPEEMNAWTPDEVRVHISEVLPKDWVVAYGVSPEQLHTGDITDAAGTVVKRCSHPDQRILLLDVYFWLYTRSMPRTSVWWRRRQDPRLRPVMGQRTASGAPEAPEPADLDPEAIRDLFKGR